jgi:hypothetical protein
VEFPYINAISAADEEMMTRVTPIVRRRKGKAAESSLLPPQDKHIENNLKCSLGDKLNVSQENCDSMVLLMKEILNETWQISTDLRVLKSENRALKCLLTEFLKENKSCSCMKSGSVISLTKCIQSSQSATDSCADGPSQGYVAAEDLHFKNVHKKNGLQRSEFPSPLSKSTEKIRKMDSEVSASGLKPKMKALLDIKAGNHCGRIVKQKQ